MEWIAQYDPSQWMVWVVLLTPRYGERLIGKLVSKGYSVESLDGKNLFAPYVNPPSFTMGIRLKKVGQTSTQVYDDVKESLDSFKAKFFTIIAVSGVSVCFGGSNIEFTEPVRGPINGPFSSTKKKTKVTHLKLVKKEEPEKTPEKDEPLPKPPTL